MDRLRKSKSSIEVGQRPRLLYVASSTGQGGIERHSVRLADALCNRGAWLRYACAPGGFPESLCAARNIGTAPLTVRNSGDLRAVRQLAQLIWQHEIDIVHVHSRRDYVPAALAVELARRAGRMASPSLILHAHMIRALGAPPNLSNWFFGKTADKVLAVSTAVRDEVCRHRQLPDHFTRILPNGVDIDLFAHPGDPRWAGWRSEQRTAWSISDQDIVIGMIGRLDAKGQATLLSAAPALLAANPNLRFVFVGSPGDSRQPGHLPAIAQSLGIADRVVWTGETERVPQALAAFDILAHLPTDESFGLAIAEAMAAGLPTVATDIGGCSEIVRHGVTGILVPVADTAALTSALATLMARGEGPALRQAMGDAGRARADQHFSLDAQIDALEQVYYELFYRSGPS